jgi:hypothetical protein
MIIKIFPLKKSKQSLKILWSQKRLLDKDFQNQEGNNTKRKNQNLKTIKQTSLALLKWKVQITWHFGSHMGKP